LNSLISCFQQAPLLAALPEETLKRLERLAEQRQYRRRQVVHFADQPGDYVYLLCTGRVKIARVSERGRELTLYLLDDGAVFGESGLMDAQEAYEMVAETLEDSLIVVFRRADILAALDESPGATRELLKLVSARRFQTENQVADLVFLEVPKRLAKLLLRLYEDQGGRSGRNGQTLRGRMTHQELANVIGSTRETTTLILNDFRRQGLIDFLGRKILIQDRAGLEKLILSDLSH
jgi:CRP/FNR family cyclic AMP-dependent transcriptional regulator